MPQGHITGTGRIKITKLAPKLQGHHLLPGQPGRQEAGDIHPFSKPDFLHLVTAGPLHCLFNPTAPPAWPRDGFSSGTQPSRCKGREHLSGAHFDTHLFIGNLLEQSSVFVPPPHPHSPFENLPTPLLCSKQTLNCLGPP